VYPVQVPGQEEKSWLGIELLCIISTKTTEQQQKLLKYLKCTTSPELRTIEHDALPDAQQHAVYRTGLQSEAV
jgi:hypothetical protein